MRKAFVTGGTGFIGSHLVEALQQRGYGEVRCLVRTKRKWLEGLDIVPVQGDLTDVEALREAVRGVDYVYHLAGITRAREWVAYEQANVSAPLTLLRLVREVNPTIKKVMITSSLAAVGPSETGIADEETPLNPISRYGRSKAEMEKALAAPINGGVSFLRKLPVVIIRPPAVYGPREADIFTFFKSVNTGFCPMIGNGREPELSLVHVRDLVRGMIDAAEAEVTAGETYFLGSDTYYSWQQIKEATTAALGKNALTLHVPRGLVGTVGAVVETISKVFGRYPPLNREKAREILETTKMCSHDKARRDFGYRQEVPLEAGIRETMAWYREEGWLK